MLATARFLAFTLALASLASLVSCRKPAPAPPDAGVPDAGVAARTAFEVAPASGTLRGGSLTMDVAVGQPLHAPPPSDDAASSVTSTLP